MPTAFRQTAIAPDCTGRYRSSIILASRLYGEWSESAKAEHCAREGRVCPVVALTISDAEYDAFDAGGANARCGYVDRPGDVESPIDFTPWMATLSTPLSAL